MKNLVFFIHFLLLFNCIAYAQLPKHVSNFTLKGKITGSKQTPVIYLEYRDSDGKKITRKTRVKNGTFTFSMWLTSPVNAEFWSGRVSHGDNDSHHTELFINPGSMALYTRYNDFDHAEITESPMKADWDALQKQKEHIKLIKDSLDGEVHKLTIQIPTPVIRAAAQVLYSKLDSCKEQEKHIEYNFIGTHPNSYISPFVMDYHGRELPLDSAIMFYNSFSPSVKNSIAGKHIEKDIAHRKASAAGSMAPLFERKEINGKTLNLKSFRDKNYVLLYFWASFCMPDEDGPNLKQLHNKYLSKGLEIVCLSGDILMKDWKGSILTNDMTGLHHIRADIDLWKKYDIPGAPPVFLFLIDKKGKIIGRYMGWHPDWLVNGDNEGSVADLNKKLIETFGN